MRPRLCVLTATLLATAALSSPAAAQLAELQPGAKVRLWAPGAVAGRVEGFVSTRGADSLTLLRPNGAPLAIRLAAITSVEVSRGKSRADGAKRGLLWGIPIGLVVGLLGPSIDETSCYASRCTPEYSDGEYVVVGLLGGAAWGAGIGALIGRERWVPLELEPRVSLGAGGRRLRVEIALPFPDR